MLVGGQLRDPGAPLCGAPGRPIMVGLLSWVARMLGLLTCSCMAARDRRGGMGGGPCPPGWLWAMGGLAPSPEAAAAAIAAAIDVGALGVLGGVGGPCPELVLGPTMPPLPTPTAPPPNRAAESIPVGKFEAGEAPLGVASASDFDARKEIRK